MSVRQSSKDKSPASVVRVYLSVGGESTVSSQWDRRHEMWSYWWCKICLVTLGSLQISSGRLPTVACPHVTSPAVGSVIRTMVQLGFHSVELQVCQNAITSLIRSGWTQSVLRVQSCIDAVSHGKWDLSDCKINELMKHHKAKLDLITSSYNRLLSTWYGSEHLGLTRLWGQYILLKAWQIIASIINASRSSCLLLIDNVIHTEIHKGTAPLPLLLFQP